MKTSIEQQVEFITEKKVTRTSLDYLRKEKKFPSVWCPGCGLGIIQSAIMRTMAKENIDKNNLVFVSGIGCTARMPAYLDACTLHTLHGRALTFATGVKMANPQLNVVVIMGDGDALAIGGNHFIHAARRNMDLTVVLVNNSIYGMTGGQFSPTTPEGSVTATTPFGNIEPAFDACDLARAAGSPYVARATVYHMTLIEKYFKQAFDKKGFSFLEVISNCHVTYGRKNKLPTAIEYFDFMKNNSVMLSKAKDMTSEELNGKFVVGVFQDMEREEYTERYYKMVKKD